MYNTFRSIAIDPHVFSQCLPLLPGRGRLGREMGRIQKVSIHVWQGLLQITMALVVHCYCHPLWSYFLGRYSFLCLPLSVQQSFKYFVPLSVQHCFGGEIQLFRGVQQNFKKCATKMSWHSRSWVCADIRYPLMVNRRRRHRRHDHRPIKIVMLSIQSPIITKYNVKLVVPATP